MFFGLQVGDSDQKLADGISLYSVMSTAYGKPNILPSLISVSSLTVVVKNSFESIEALIALFSMRNLEPYYFVGNLECMHDIPVPCQEFKGKCWIALYPFL